jgi:GAF domain-containing protein
LEINELLNETARLISERFGFYHIGVFLLEDDRKYAILQASYPQAGYGMLKIGHKLEVGKQGIVGFVTQTGKYYLAPNVDEDPYHLFNPDLPNTRSEMVFPLIVHGQVIGALDVQSEKVVTLRDGDVATLQTMADQLANAIHNAQLYRQVSERLEEANVLQQVAVSLAGASELNEVLSLILSGAMKLTDTHGISVLLWDTKLEKFTQTFRIDEGGTLQSYISQARSEGGRAREIINKRRSIAISDAQQIPDFNPAFLEKGYRASLGVPLLSQGEAIGVFYVHDKEPRQFSERQIALLEALAGQVAVAVDRARRYEELKRTKGLVGARTAVAWMGMVSSTWRHTIEGHALTIREEIAAALTDLHNSCLDKMEERLTKIERLAGQVLDKPITPPLSEEEGVESVPVNGLLRERVRQLWEHEPYQSVQQQLELNLEDTATVRASPEWLRRIFDVLVDNAIEAVADVSPQVLTISTQVVGSTVEIIFTDNGRGIPEEVLPKLLHEQIKKIKGTKGLGMGLLMAQTIAQTYGGEIRVGATSSKGTSLIVSLPIEFQKGT